ncbi:MAG: C10 family peptidase [Bacteroidaceae bacterium]|nr:C10 family peptidase [Bacteroidaceae bacterium]
MILLNLLLAGAACYAQPVGRQQAEALAKQWLGGEVSEMGRPLEAEAKGRNGGDDTPCYYVFGRATGGFVIVGGETRLPAIVAYAKEAAWGNEDLPPALEGFLNAYTRLVQEVRQGEEVLIPLRSMEEAVPVVEPLCKTAWNQQAPYNSLCPVDGTKTCPVGCVALAMAQIMKYYEWPLHGRGKVYYTPQRLPSAGMLYVDFSESVYDWDAMLNTTAELKANKAAADAVAKLCYDCGVSSRMEYGAESSGTYDDYAIQSMYENFGYKASTIKIVYRDCYATQEEWDAIWKAELDEGRPVLYSGATTGGDGHEFVVDGYDSNGFVHVNWGWGGVSDGYFDVTVLNATASQSFSSGQGMIIGIVPDYTGKDVVHAPVVPYMASPFSLTGTLLLGKNKLVTVSNVYNRSRSAQTWQVGVGLYSLDGMFIANMAVNEVSKAIPAMSGIASSTVMMDIPVTTPNGEYVVCAIFRSKAEEEWMFPNVVGGATNNRVYTTIADGVATFAPSSSSIYNICIDDSDEGNVEVMSHQYFDLTGKPVKEPQKGIMMDVQTFSNGEKKVQKVLF